MVMILYNLKSSDGEFLITKFDDDLNPVDGSSYIVSDHMCQCPQWVGRQKACRHMRMLPMMIERLDTPWFFCFDGAQAGMWSDPTGQAQEDEAIANEPAPSAATADPSRLPINKSSPSLRRRF